MGNKKFYLLLFFLIVLVFVGIVSHDLIVLVKQPIWADEYVFLKITDELPKYSSTSEWLNDYKFSIRQESEMSIVAYETEVWGHPPMANIIVYPLVKTVGEFVERIWVYRLFYAVLMLVTVGLIVDVIRRKFGWLVTSFTMLPVVISQYLVMAGIYVYHDGVMCLFLALSIWLIEVKPESKWKYATGTAVVLTKIYATAFLLPLALLYYKKNWKMILCGFGLVPFLTYQWIVTGNPTYIFSEHWTLSNQWNWETFRVIVLPNIWSYVVDWGLYIHVPLVIGGIITWAKGMRELHWSYILLYVLLVGLAVNGGLMGNKTYPIMFGAMFIVVPLAQKLLAKIERREMELANVSNIL